MGFWSSLGSSAMSAVSSMSLHDLTGGWSDYASRKASAKYESELARDLMEHEAELSYQNQMQALRNSPSAYKAGLIAAGYNPMLAVSNGVNMANPSVPSASSGRMPSSDGSSKPFEGLARRVRETADAELENLEAQGDSIRAHTDFDAANSAADVNLKNAQAEKIRKEADSIDPVTERENQRYGRSHGNQQLLDSWRVFRDAFHLGGSPSDSLVAPSSAKGAKVMNEKARLIQEERKNRVREGRANPRRKGREGRRKGREGRR